MVHRRNASENSAFAGAGIPACFATFQKAQSPEDSNLMMICTE